MAGVLMRTRRSLESYSTTPLLGPKTHARPANKRAISVKRIEMVGVGIEEDEGKRLAKTANCSVTKDASARLPCPVK
jgi:hypothetical protein